MPAVQRAGRGLRPREPRARAPSATATSTASTARRSGRRSPRTPSSASSSRARAATCRSTAASPTSSSRWTSPGIEVRPIREMTGEALFNEVFFTDVRVPAENLIGEEHLGWGMAKTTLANERVSLSTGGGLQWGYGPSARDLVQLIRDRGGLADPVHAPARGRRVHRRRDPALPPHAHDLGRGEQAARPRRVAAQGARRPARQEGVHARPRPHGRARACSRAPT